MDKELLARKLYAQRVNQMVGEQIVDEQTMTQFWESKAAPCDAAKAILHTENEFQGPAWLSRYLKR